MFPIKYIENNLVFNHDGECFAYYELTPYNYSFLSPEEKYMVHDNFRQLIAQNRDGKIHALQIATEDSLRAVQERSKKGITGRLKEIACKKVDEQTEALVEMIGENQIDYRFFLGFKLLVNEEEISFKGMRKSAAMTFTDFIYEVNHRLMGDFVSMSNDEINRYMKMEKLLESKISRRFQFRRLDKNDFGYLLEHIYGNAGVAYSDYSYDLPIKKLKRETLVKRYDLIRPTRCMIEENQRYLKIEREDQTTFVAYFTINNIVGELDFPSKADNTKQTGNTHTRANHNTSASGGGNSKPPALPDSKSQKPLALPDKKNQTDSSQTVHNSESHTQESQSTSKRGIVDKKSVSKQPQSEKQNPQRPIVDKAQDKQESKDKERQAAGSATKRAAPVHERPATMPVPVKSDSQATSSKPEQNVKERPVTVTKEQTQSSKTKEPVTKSQENVRTQVVRESRPADKQTSSAVNKHSQAATDGSRQTVQRKSQTKTVQKKTTNQSSVKKSTSKKGGKK